MISSRPANWQAWPFMLPALVLLILFAIWPIFFGAWLAFTDFSLVKPASWVGFDNFRELLGNDLFLTGCKNSMLFLLIVPVMQVLALALAVLVNQKLPGMAAFRTVFYVPVVTTVAAVGIMWGFLLHEQGTVNYVLLKLHLINTPLAWLNDEHLALLAIMLVTIWRGLGWYMVMYLAALQALPREVDEAAILDGANAWQRFWRITVPQLKPAILLCSVLSLLGALKIYQEVDVMTQGGPMDSTYTALYFAYDQGLKHLKLSRALAASFVMSGICIALALLCWRVIKPKTEQA
jgi:putative chitobiose transport system permease protein